MRFTLMDLACETNIQVEIGGKAKNLHRLLKAGIPVPKMWVVPAEIFHRHLVQQGLDGFALSVAENPLGEACQKLRRAIRNTRLDVELEDSLSMLPDIPYAVRSSASVEDGSLGSYSGLFKTRLGLEKGEELLEAVKDIWVSVFTPKTLTYHRRVSQTRDYPLMAVLIMPLLDAQISGVAFSANPSDGNPFQIAVVASPGPGPSVVNGSGDCHNYILERSQNGIGDSWFIQQAEGFGQEIKDDETEGVSSTIQSETLLSELRLRQLGEVVWSIDNVLNQRVDVEFVFCSTGLAVLQARGVLGLPAYFPDNPAEENENVYFCHEVWTDPLPRLLRTTCISRHKDIPEPPWPLEVDEIFFHHGRMFGKLPAPVQSEDRSFLSNMQKPERDPHGWACWTKRAYQDTIPRLRTHSEQLLSLSKRELESMKLRRVGRLLQDAIDLESQAGIFYLSASYPTAESIRRVRVLLNDWLFPDDVTGAEQVALELIKGIPKLTNERQAELEAVAWDGKDLKAFVRRWGYSYLVRDEAIYVSKWRSWREDPEPLYIAIKLMRNSNRYRPIKNLIEISVRESNDLYASIRRKIGASDSEHKEMREDIFAALVEACRRHFPLKDDRDLVLSHAQAALRWVLMEAARRLRRTGVVNDESEVFFFERQELLEFFDGRRHTLKKLATTIVERRREHDWLSSIRRT